MSVLLDLLFGHEPETDCGCGHKLYRHLRGVGPCSHGCGCTRFEKRL